MATIFAHAALPALGVRALKIPAPLAKRLTLTAVAAACLPDVDFIGALFGARPEELLGHRGLTHSLGFAAALALVLAFTFPREHRRLAFISVFCAGASHGLLDMATYGDIGVAWLWPLSSARLLLPVRPLPVVPLGVAEIFGRWGLLVMVIELFVLVIPAAVVVRWLRGHRRDAVVGALAWALTLTAARFALPELFAGQQPRILYEVGVPGSDEDLAQIPRDGLPNDLLVTRFDALQGLGLLGRELAPAQVPWSSGFFPSWFGEEAGRWRDSGPTLVWRTLNGFQPPGPGPFDASTLFGLSPTEKYDLARGDASFTATRAGLLNGHNRDPKPRYWFGLCNGVATASLNHPEPFRVVDVVSPSGQVISFHPYDVKALLAASYFWTSEAAGLDSGCSRPSFDSGRACSMNAAGFVIALLNRIGIAKSSFLVDVHPTMQAQYYAIASVKIDAQAPKPESPMPLTETVRARAKSFVDVSISMTASSTTLSASTSDVRDPAWAEGSGYQKVGLRPVPFHYLATLALDANQEIIGGGWRGDPADGPDTALFPSNAPLLDGGMLELNAGIRWDAVQTLARAAVDEGPARPRLTAAQVWPEADAASDAGQLGSRAGSSAGQVSPGTDGGT